MFKSTLLICLFVMFNYAAHAKTGFRLEHVDPKSSRPLNVAIWYPTQQERPRENMGANMVFVGTEAVVNAEPSSGAHPLLLISHGYGGSWRNLNWLAQPLAAQGYIVAAPDHPGTTTFDKTPAAAAQLWERSRDLRRVMDRLIADPELAGQVDRRRIAALGHSLGGWTVLQLAGARFDSRRFLNDCQQHAELSGCRIAQTLGIGQAAEDKLDGDSSDPRIRAVISLDLGLARGFTPDSLRKIHIPVLIMSAGADSRELPVVLESGYLTRYIAPRWQRYIRVSGATHFSFMQLCKPGAETIIEAEAPGEGIVCRDGAFANRRGIHELLLTEISTFLRRALALPHTAGGIVKD